MEKSRRRRLTLKWSAGVLALAAVLFGASVWLTYFPPNGKTVYRIKTAPGLVALTFDDGPHPDHTRELLALLKERGDIKATFFMTGKHVDAYPAIAREVDAAGHEISNHGYDETVLAYRSRRFIEDSIGRTDQALSRALGETSRKSPYFRAPQGLQFLTVASVLKRQGRTHIGGFALGNDWKPDYQENPERIANKVLDDLEAGDIIILHDGDDRVGDAAEGSREGTVAAVRLILDRLEAMGLKPVTVGELLSSAGDGG